MIKPTTPAVSVQSNIGLFDSVSDRLLTMFAYLDKKTY